MTPTKDVCDAMFDFRTELIDARARERLDAPDLSEPFAWKGDVEAAVLAERERCAKIAEGYEYDGYNDDDAAGDIADRIRSGE